MGEPSTTSESAAPAARLPLALTASGVGAFLGSLVLAARLIWEQTVWTWERGPQMIGFSLAHGSGALLFIFPFLLLLWTALVAVLTIRSLLKKIRVAKGRWVSLGLAVLLFLLMGLPEGVWERAFIRQMAASPRAADLLVYAAYRGDLSTVEALISHGVQVDATDASDRRTALHAAAVSGNLQELRYLVSRGANINALDRSGDSPLELAASRGFGVPSKFLVDSGAKRIRGSQEQHRQAISDKVNEDIEQLDRAEAADPKLQRDIRNAERNQQMQNNKAR